MEKTNFMAKRQDEKALREAFEKDRGSMRSWSKAAPAKVKKGNGIVFSIRFSSDELKLLRNRATALGTNLSGLIRKTLFDDWAHQPAYVFDVKITKQPRLCIFGQSTQGTVTTIGGTTIYPNSYTNQNATDDAVIGSPPGQATIMQSKTVR